MTEFIVQFNAEADYTLQFNLHTLVSTVTPLLSLLDGVFERRTSPILCAPELSSASATSF
jgi:hypothetical protein